MTLSIRFLFPLPRSQLFFTCLNSQVFRCLAPESVLLLTVYGSQIIFMQGSFVFYFVFHFVFHFLHRLLHTQSCITLDTNPESSLLNLKTTCPTKSKMEETKLLSCCMGTCAEVFTYHLSKPKKISRI